MYHSEINILTPTTTTISKVDTSTLTIIATTRIQISVIEEEAIIKIEVEGEEDIMVTIGHWLHVRSETKLDT